MEKRGGEKEKLKNGKMEKRRGGEEERWRDRKTKNGKTETQKNRTYGKA